MVQAVEIILHGYCAENIVTPEPSKKLE